MATIVKLSNSDRTREVYVNADRIAFFVPDGSGKTDIHFGPGQSKTVGQAQTRCSRQYKVKAVSRAYQLT